MAVNLIVEPSVDMGSDAPETSGDSSFVSLLTAHQGVIQAYLNTLLPGDSEVSDIVQKANLVLWNKRNNFEPGTNFKAWALSIAYWEARAWMTTRKRKGWLIYNEDLVDAVTERFVSGAGSKLEPSESVDALRLCLAKLRESDRLAIMNHYQHDKSIAECSEVLGRSREAIKSTLFRSRAALKRCIRSQLAVSQTTQ